MKHAYVRAGVVNHISTSAMEEMQGLDCVVTIYEEGVEIGDLYDGEVFSKPPAVAPFYPSVTRVEFLLLFTLMERMKIKVARKTDAVIDEFYTLLEDPSLRTVNLGLQSTQQALAYLVSVGLLSEDRVPEILKGEPK